MPFRLAFGSLVFAFAQAAPAGLPSVPTTRVLAIGHISATTTREKLVPVMQQEVRDTVRLYLSGNGVDFLLDVTTVQEARSLLEKLPLAKQN